MAILIEGMTLVFENNTLEAKYPGGLYGFRSTWDNGSYCTDGTISRLSFFEEDDGFCVFWAMREMGLDIDVKYAADVAIIMHSGRLWTPCLWLDTQTNLQDYSVCWYFAEEIGKVSVPRYFNKGVTFAKLQGLTKFELSNRISRFSTNGDVAMFKDQESETTIYGPRQLCRH